MTDSGQAGSDIKVAMVTGHHEYDVVDFQRLLRDMPGVDFYPQHMEEFVIDSIRARKQYDVIAFYNYQQETPGEGDDELGKKMRDALEALGENGQGIFMLHHSLTAFPDWQHWLDICGMRDPRVAPRPGPPSRVDQRMRIEIADRDHPITRGMKSWEMVDETYNMSDATEGSHILLTTDHPECMRTIAWTRQHKSARVFSLQSGHDNQTYGDPQFRGVIARGIRWVAGRI